MTRTRVKICGVRDVVGALAGVEAGADALGFVFVASSVRCIDPEDAYEIACYLPPFVTKVALFADASPEEIEAIGEVFPFDIAQLHGQEDASAVREIRESTGVPILKAIRFEIGSIESEFRRWNDVAEIDAVLVDGSSGGEGRTLDWQALAGVREVCEHPLVLAGGLTPENVGEAIRIVRPYAVDVSSGVEHERGQKDAVLMRRFCEAVWRA